METITLKCHVHYETCKYTGKTRYRVWENDMSAVSDCGIHVGPASFKYTVPADFNPVASQLSALEKQKAELTRQFTERVAELNEQISKLQSISMDVKA